MVKAFRSLPAYHRAEVRDALERRLRDEPTRVSKSRIKRLPIAPVVLPLRLGPAMGALRPSTSGREWSTLPVAAR
jgi:hypothetical protein